MIIVDKSSGAALAIVRCDRCGCEAKPIPNERHVEPHLFVAEAGFVLVIGEDNVHRDYCQFCAGVKPGALVAPQESSMAKKKTTGSNGHRVERIVRTLRCDLTPDEVSERGDRAAHLLAKRDEKDADRKAAQSQMGAQIKELESELRRVSTEVRDRAAFRPVECEVRFDYARGRVITVRLDTGAQIDERPMESHERQAPLPIGDEGETEPQPVH